MVYSAAVQLDFPVKVFLQLHRQTVDAFRRSDSDKITLIFFHITADQAGITVGGAFAMLISCLRYGKSLDAALKLVEKHLASITDAAETLAAIDKAGSAKSITELGEGWVAGEALAIGIYCALRHTWNFKEGVLEAINITGAKRQVGDISDVLQF